MSTGWMPKAAYDALAPFRLHREASDGSVHGRAFDTLPGHGTPIHELRRLWLAIFDARFGGKS